MWSFERKWPYTLPGRAPEDDDDAKEGSFEAIFIGTVYYTLQGGSNFSVAFLKWNSTSFN